MKQILFTNDASSLTPSEDLVVGVIGEIKKVEGLKQVPALKLIKAMKQMEKKEEYVVEGDERYVEAAKKLGFKKLEQKVEPKEDPRISQLAEKNTQLENQIGSLQKRIESLQEETGTTTKQYSDRLTALESQLGEKNKEVESLKKEVKDILLS